MVCNGLICCHRSTGLCCFFYTSHASQSHVRSGSSALLRSYAGEIGGIFVETSAKSGINVQEIFTDIGETSRCGMVLARTHSPCRA